MDHFVGPDFEAIGARAERAAAAGMQRGSFGATVAIAPLVPLGLGKDEQIRVLGALQHPFHAPPPLEHDLRFALDLSREWAQRAGSERLALLRHVERVASALRPAEDAARALQQERVRKVAGSVATLFVAFMVVFCMWPHRDIVKRFTTGYPVIGVIPPTGVFRQFPRSATASAAELLEQAEQWHDEVFALPKPDDAEEIFDATMKEVAAGTMSPLRDRSYYDSLYGRRGWRGVIRFGVWQNDKFRPIEDGKRSGHNSGQTTLEKVHHCPQDFIVTAAIHLVQGLSLPLPDWAQVESGVDDLENAYRSCPTDAESDAWTVVLLYDVHKGRWRASAQYGHSYGFRSSVNNFNAWPELGVAFCRRALAVATSHYVDDFPTVDFGAGRGSAQRALNRVFELAGGPFADKKRIAMPPVTVFLGQVNDASDMVATGRVTVRPKPGRGATILSFVRAARATGRLSPSVAGKLRGLVGFYGTSIHGARGKGRHATAH